MKLTPFHLAIPVRDIEESRLFYSQLLGCEEGRSSAHWVDFNLFGHQFVCHLNANLGRQGKVSLHYNAVDKHQVPVPHFGVVLEMDQWQALADKLTAADIEFVVKPCLRFEGEVGEQATLFFLDPSGNALEFKAFKDMGQLFAK